MRRLPISYLFRTFAGLSLTLVIACCACFFRARTPDVAWAQVGATRGTPSFVQWDIARAEQRAAPPLRVCLSTDGTQVAFLLEGEGAIRVHDIEAGGVLGGLLWTSDRTKYLVLDFAWDGRDLISWAVPGAIEKMAASVREGSGDEGDRVWDYVGAHSELVAFAPPPTAPRKLLDGGGVPLFNADRSMLAICDPTSISLDRKRTKNRFSAATYSWPALSPIRVTVADKDWTSLIEEGGRRDQYPLLLSGNQDNYIILPGSVTGAAYEGSSLPVGVDAIYSLSLVTGRFLPLTNAEERRLPQVSLSGLPTIVEVDGRHLLACLLMQWKSAPWRLVYLDGDGTIVRQYRLGLSLTVFDNIFGRRADWLPKAITPDGRNLIVQDTGRRDHEVSARHWVYSLDLEKMTGVPIAELSDIEQVYGWAQGGGLVVGVSAGADKPLQIGTLRIPHSGQKESTNK